MKRLSTIVCILAFSWPCVSTAEEAVPRLPETATTHSTGSCQDPVTKASMVCFIRKDGIHTYTIYRDKITGEAQRITWSEAFGQPETIWVRHGYDTF